MQIQLNGRIKLIRLKFKRNGVPWKIFLLHFPSFVKAILPLEIKLISEPITDPLLKDISRYDVVSRGMERSFKCVCLSRVCSVSTSMLRL